MITIITIENCGPCEKVETILRAEGHDVKVIPFDSSDKMEKREIANVLRNEGAPVIFKGTEYLGSGIMAVHKVDPDINIAKYMQEG